MRFTDDNKRLTQAGAERVGRIANPIIVGVFGAIAFKLVADPNAVKDALEAAGGHLGTEASQSIGAFAAFVLNVGALRCATEPDGIADAVGPNGARKRLDALIVDDPRLAAIEVESDEERYRRYFRLWEGQFPDGGL